MQLWEHCTSHDLVNLQSYAERKRPSPHGCLPARVFFIHPAWDDRRRDRAWATGATGAGGAGRDGGAGAWCDGRPCLDCVRGGTLQVCEMLPLHKLGKRISTISKLKV